MPAKLLRDLGRKEVVLRMLVKPTALPEHRSVHVHSREEKVAEVLLSVLGVRAIPILGPELRQPRWSDVLRATAEIIFDGDIVPADVEHRRGVDSVNDVARDIQRV